MSSAVPPSGSGVTVYLALGTNLGDRAVNLAAAREALAQEVRVLESSPIYETPPWGVLDQPAFLNQVIKVETALPPLDLLALLKGVEGRLGRQPSERWGPRLIDLDILLYDDQVLETPGLSIPHPRMAERAFVLIPLADLAPNLRIPLLNRTVTELALEADRSGIRPYSPGVQPGNDTLRGATMTEETPIKPLNWVPDPDIGYTVTRRPDGGMHYTFTDLSHRTLEHWRDFALEHLLSSDRLTRNLYDLRQVKEIPPEAVDYAVEVNSDPLARNIRAAVVVANREILHAIQEVAALTTPTGVELAAFTDMKAAQEWLDRPLTLLT